VPFHEKRRIIPNYTTSNQNGVQTDIKGR
jgi:hypothetical protein